MRMRHAPGSDREVSWAGLNPLVSLTCTRSPAKSTYRIVAIVIAAVFLLPCCCAQESRLQLGTDRLVFQTAYGDIHLAFYPEIAPQTVKNIRRLAALGAYTTNHFFRVDAGFVAQVADVQGGRLAPMDEVQQQAASRTVPLEVHPDVKHNRRGLLSMARYSDPNSGKSSFSITLGPAPHLDMQYTIFGEVTKGLEVLATFEKMPTRREGIFVMPESRIDIVSTYMYVVDPRSEDTQSMLLYHEALESLQRRYDALAIQLQEERQRKLPGR